MTSHLHSHLVGKTLALASLTIALLGCSSTSPRTSGIAPGESRMELELGNRRFLDGGMEAHTWQNERVIKTGSFGQSPSVGVLTCADSRTPPEILFDQGVGDLFVVRIAGNFQDPGALGTFEYGFAALGMHTLVVLGHTKCGAVGAAYGNDPLPGNMPVFTAAIRPGLVGLPTPANGADGKPNLDGASEANVRYQMTQILAGSEMLRKAHADGKLGLLGAIYDVNTGRVRFLD